MRLLQMDGVLDKAAIGFSGLCVAHCLILPLVLVLVPSLAVFGLDSEQFHLGMLGAVIPISLIGLTLGCKKHNRSHFLMLGVLGVSLMVSAVVLGHDYLGETGEVAFTLLGAAVISFAHFKNFRECQKVKDKSCGCEGEK